MKVLLRRVAWGAGFVILLLAVVAGGVYAAAGHSLGRPFAIESHPVADPAPDSTLLARGAHMAGAIGKCAECHGDDMGGKVIVDDPAFALLAAPNLTRGRGGVAASMTMADWELAVRHGVGPGGRGLLMMPSDDYAPMSDEDFAALMAYLRQLPPVDREEPRSELRMVGRAMYVAGRLPLVSAARIDQSAGHPSVPEGATAEYGAYLAQVAGCAGCHGPNLSGGPIPGMPPETPPASNLTPEGIGAYSEADFFRAMRDGVRPDGSQLNPVMPVHFTKLMTDDETRAIYLYLRTVPSRPYGGR